MNVTVLGSGGWGTALAMVLHDNHHAISLWSAFPEESARLRETLENPYLPGVTLPDDIVYTDDIACVAGADLVVLAVPSFAVRNTARALAKHIRAGVTPVVIVSKGIERESGAHFVDVVADELGADVALAALSGPSHAEEVARHVPTACVAVAHDIAVAELVQDTFMNDRFRVYTSTDVIGVELGAALKNVFALAVGISDGLGHGDNTTAALMTRGLSEMTRLALALGGNRSTLAGLAGLGDLIVTCTSRHSRNRRAGVYIGQGLCVADAMDRVGAVVEGYYAAEAGMKLAAEAGIDMPILAEVYQVLYENKPPAQVLHDLMTRSKRAEYDVFC